MDYKRLFLNWLEQHHIRQKFLFNCRTIRSAVDIRRCYPIKYIWKEEPSLYIINSFAWSDSSEGFRFWDDCDFLWRDYFNQYMLTHNK
jgi:hypothetical protein